MITRVVARTLIYNEQGNLLFLVRSKNDGHRPGELDLPGGGAEPNEDPVTAAIRETQEETGIALNAASMYLVYSRTSTTAYNTSEKQATSLVRVFFLAKIASAEVTLNPDEHDAFMWLSPEEVDARVTYPVHREAIDYVNQNHILEDILR